MPQTQNRQAGQRPDHQALMARFVLQPVVVLDESYRLLDLPDIILELIMDDLGFWDAVEFSGTCHKLPDLFVSIDPPRTLLDDNLFQPKFSTLQGSSAAWCIYFSSRGITLLRV